VLSRLDAIEGFLRQRASDASTFEQTLSALQRVL
jgi:flagellar biosynthesis/type III secretory pathway ATPase